VKMLIGITAGLALLLGPTAVYAGKKDNKSHNKTVDKSESSKKVDNSETDKSFSAEDSFQDNSEVSKNNVECGGLVTLTCGQKASVINGGKGGVLNDLLGGGIKNLLNDLLGDGLLF
ncbi:MAG: hypothetical protein ACRD1K_00725, partial [Acidimicrobiales bacterium]